MPPKLNAKGRPFSWSYSALNDFENCPTAYGEKRFYCRVPFVETEPLIWGNRVHKQAEDFLKSKPITDEEAFKPVAPWCEAIMRSGYHITAELELAFDENMQLVKWFDKRAWLRAKIDVTLLDYKQEQCILYDWKTGKLKDNDDQLRLTAAAYSMYNRKPKVYEGAYIWLKDQVTTSMRPLSKEQIPVVWQEFLKRVARMQEAWETETFSYRQSGLCGWCQANCKYRK